jgi:S1-C subfamily serine protease
VLIRHRPVHALCAQSVLSLAFLTLLPAFAASGDQIAPEVLKKVKKATVYLRVTLPDDRVVQGSGFFAGATNVVITNGHVVGMLSPDGRPPKKIEVIAQSGEPEERTYSARVLQVDPTADLAALIVTGKDFPPPLPIVQAKDLVETQTVFVFGFPFGKSLGKNITVSKTSVSSLRKKAGGVVQDIQVNGGIHPGNSGGPVVDAQGRVVGVSVAGVPGAQIQFAIAGEAVQSFLVGRMHVRVFLAPYKEAEAHKLPIVYRMVDPLGQITKVTVETWTGAPGDARKAVAKTGVEPLPDDSPHETFEFTYKGREARGEVTLPALPKGKMLWVQMSYERRGGARVWMAANAYPNKLAPVERKPVTLVYEHHLDQPCRLELTATTDLRIRALDGADKHLVTEIKAQMVERLVGKDQEDSMPGAIGFTQLGVKTTLEKEVLPDPVMDKSLKSSKALQALTLIDKQGDLKPLRIEVAPAVRDLNARLDLTWVGQQVLQGLEAVTVPLPGKEVSHDKPWKAQRKLVLGSQSGSQPALVDVIYTLHGMREGAGRSDAVVFLTGQVRGQKGSGAGVSGRMDGQAVVDLKTRHVRFADVNLNLDLDLTDGKNSVQANGTLKIVLKRTPLEGAEREKTLKEGGSFSPALVYAHRGLARLGEGDLEKASADYDRALSLDAKEWTAGIGRVVTLMLNRDAMAEAAARQFIDVHGWKHPFASYAAIFGHLASRQAGDDKAAGRWLVDAAKAGKAWPAPVVRYLRGQLDADGLLAQARTIGDQTEAHCYVALALEQAGKHDEARTHYQWVRDRGDTSFIEYAVAVTQLKRSAKATR